MPKVIAHQGLSQPEAIGEGKINKKINSNLLLYSLHIMPKHATTLRNPSPRHCAASLLHSSFPKNVAAVASRWQHCVQFDRREIWTFLCPIWPAQDLNLRPPASDTIAFSLDQLAG